jgi:hypothetical protein
MCVYPALHTLIVDLGVYSSFITPSRPMIESGGPRVMSEWLSPISCAPTSVVGTGDWLETALGVALSSLSIAVALERCLRFFRGTY